MAATAYACPTDAYHPFHYQSAKEEQQRAKQLHAEGHTPAEIAWQLGCSQTRIKAYIH